MDNLYKSGECKFETLNPNLQRIIFGFFQKGELIISCFEYVYIHPGGSSFLGSFDSLCVEGYVLTTHQLIRAAIYFPKSILGFNHNKIQHEEVIAVYLVDIASFKQMNGSVIINSQGQDHIMCRFGNDQDKNKFFSLLRQAHRQVKSL